MLVFNDLWKYTSGEIVKPTNAADIPAWAAKDEKALALIVLSMGKNQLNYVKKATSNKDAWDELEKTQIKRIRKPIL